MSPLFFKVANAIMPPISGFLCSGTPHRRIAKMESTNKIRTIESVEFAERFLGGELPIKELVSRIHAADRFRSLWLAEGLGQHYANRVLKRDEHPKNLFTEGEGSDIPENLLLMANAGMALSFARHHLDRLGSSPTQEAVKEAAQRTADLVTANALPGYAGISYEAWGMVTRFFYRKVFPGTIEAMEEIDPVHVPNMWHGAGRAVYFFDFMPKWNEPWPVFQRIDREATGHVARLNLLAGLGSVTVIVNMKTPEILETIVRERIAKLPPEDIAAYSQGISCSMVMRQDTTPDEANARALVRHTPTVISPELWEQVVAGPARLALDTIHPRLKAEKRLDAITCFTPVEEILNRPKASGV
jgi:hypothetical protein